MLNGLIQDAFRILSESYTKIGEFGVAAVDYQKENSPKSPRAVNKLVECVMLYDTIMDHVVLNQAGTAIASVRYQDISVVNDLLLQLKKAVGIYSLPVFPTPLTTYEFSFGDNNGNFDIGPGQLGDLIVHNGTVFTNFGMGADGTVLVSTPLGLQWQSVVGNGIPSGGTTGQYLRKNSNASYDVVWDTLTISKITDITANAAEINKLDGALWSTLESNTLVGIDTSQSIQAQLDAKQNSTLANGQFWVGNSLGAPVARTPSGQVTFNNAGTFSISAGVIVDSHISASAGIARSKIAVGNPNRIVVNNASGVMSDAAAITANRALISSSTGIPTHSNVSNTELGYLSGVTSAVQTQINSKLTVSLTTPTQGDLIYFNGTNWVNLSAAAGILTSDGTTVSWGPSAGNGIPSGGTTAQVLRKTNNTDYVTEWHTLVVGDLTDISATAAQINVLSGISPSLTATELNYLINVTADIQTQLDGKQSRSLGYNNLWVGNGANIAAQLAPGNDGDVLTMVGTTPQWQPTTPPGNVSGPISSTDNAIARWNGTSGDSIQNSGVLVDDTNNLVFPTGTAIRTSLAAGNSLFFQAYDVDGAAYVTFATLTANNTPTFDLGSSTTIGTSYIYRAGGNDVSLADGGTGSSLADPGGDRLLGWDEVTNAVDWIVIGSGLLYSPSTKTLSASGGGGTEHWRGGYNASTNLFPAAGGSTGGDPQAGDMWNVTVAGTLGGESANVTAILVALVNSPGQTAANWRIL
jgi:hypothetical protein